MRLNSIKLAGFKSFVEPTYMALQSNLTAIVGPNGCGKSNIVDAIYCVLGSTSKNLRAEQISDVIFNGTNARPPVAQASIELVFDNSEGRIAGEYAQYQEISIRRELSRDGGSNYYLNGVRCRRRDITDIFLGTGLGNNNYAIIEQGMISRLIEAKPEELGAHVGEAAKTSIYKERRRETENRIKHTRENLDRLNDLREEQGKQLNHLQKQANAAEKYKVLKTEQRLIRAQLQAILWQGLNDNMTSYTAKIQKEETRLEAKIADLRQIDKEVENKRSQRLQQQDLLNNVQSDYYGLGSEISRTEQQINHLKERKKLLENDYQQLENSYQELKQQHFEDENQLQELNQEIDQIEISFAKSKEQAEEYQEKLLQAERQMHIWQEEWDEFNRICANSSKQVEVERTKIQHLEQKHQSLLSRLTRIKEEQGAQNSEIHAEEALRLKKQQEECQLDLQALEEQLSFIQERMQTHKNHYQQAQVEVAQFTKELRDLQAQHASLQAMQQIAFGKNDAEIGTWLNHYQLNTNQRLAESLEVEAGWELAVETVLSNYLDAVCVDTFAPLIDSLAELKNTNISFFNTQGEINSSIKAKNLPKLQDKIISTLPVANLLSNIYIVEDFADGFELLTSLKNDESIITRDGIWFNNNWLRVSKIKTEKTGVLQREHLLKDLHHQIVAGQDRLAKQEAFCHEAQEQLHHDSEERERILHQLQTIKAKNSDLLAQIRVKESLIEQLTQKNILLAEELVENSKQVQEAEQNLTLARTNLTTFVAQGNQEGNQRDDLVARRDTLKLLVEEARQQANLYKQKKDESQVRLESTRSQVHFLNQNLGRVQRQLANVAERRLEIEQSLTNLSDPLPDQDRSLQQLLEKHAIKEEELAKARQAMEMVEASLVDLEKNRHEVEQHMQEIRSELEQMRLECQTLKVKITTCEEQIAEGGFILETLLQDLLEDACALGWEENLAKIDQRIQRLGPINLAAIDEYANLAERKLYLDKQHDDLVEALNTLENAIRKIDQETRQRFKDTFNQLNESFKNYFSQIFGGGVANLELTSDDLLETGVIVKAQPPGKRNSTIHLLSGGEKALTAIALVFAIFSLNPAPFCVLDEVDAPLDDVNVGRFCNLVKNMSEKIQFIFISHNKITIEMGQQLAGVTMHEPGVSRLVSVDVEQAISMATA